MIKKLLSNSILVLACCSAIAAAGFAQKSLKVHDVVGSWSGKIVFTNEALFITQMKAKRGNDPRMKIARPTGQMPQFNGDRIIQDQKKLRWDVTLKEDKTYHMDMVLIGGAKHTEDGLWTLSGRMISLTERTWDGKPTYPMAEAYNVSDDKNTMVSTRAKGKPNGDLVYTRQK